MARFGQQRHKKKIVEITTRKSFCWSIYLSVNQSIHCVDRLFSLLSYDIQIIVMHVIFAFEFDRNFEILILWNSGRDCRVTTAIVSSSN